MSLLFDALVSLDASLAACGTAEAVPGCVLDHVPSLLPCTVRGIAVIDEATLLPRLDCCEPRDCRSEVETLLATAIGDGRFALALRRGQAVIHELGGGRAVLLQALATPTHLAGLLVGGCADSDADADRLAALALAAARIGAAHENLTLRARILAHADELEHAVAERTHDLAEERDRAESASRAKSAFLATVSHELRTPLNGIIGMAELLHADEQVQGRRDRLDVVRACAEDLLRQIDSILDLSRVESGRHDLNPAETALDPLVMAVLRTLAPQAQGKGVELAWIPGPAVPQRLLVDAGRLRQVLMNLVGNAVKFSDHGAVVVRGEATNESGRCRFSIAVSDDGPGIAPEAMARLFRPFEQADASINRRFGGSGLGLSISRRLCEMMDGTITVESCPGHGATFTAVIRVPALPPASQHSLAVSPDLRLGGPVGESVAAMLARLGARLGGPNSDVAIVDADDPLLPARLRDLPASLPVLLLAPLSGPGREAIAALGGRRYAVAAKPPDPEELAALAAGVVSGRSSATALHSTRIFTRTRYDGARVLYADDQQVNRLVLAGQLKRLGIAVELALGGAEAVTLALADAWDVILLDCQMPEVDGFQAAGRIRAGGCRVPLVAVTAHAMAGDREECLLRGFDDYLAKPVRLDELAAMLGRWLGGQDARRASAADGDPFAALCAEVGTDVAREVLAAMLHEAPRLVAEAVAAAGLDDLPTAGRRAHALKGDSGNLGLADLAAAAADLEAAAKSAAVADARAAAARLGAAWAVAEAQLRHHLA